MVTHYFSLICGHAVIDERTKFLSVFDVIEQINVKGEPDQAIKIPMRFDLVSVWMKIETKDLDKGVSRISLSKPGDIISNISEVEINLTESTFFRSIIQFSGIELTGPGLYKFVIEFRQTNGDWAKVSEVPFVVSYKLSDKQS